VIVTGDWNTVVGEGRDGTEVGQFALGDKNERGESLVDFCQRKFLISNTSTCFEQEKRMYMWKQPGDTGSRVFILGCRFPFPGIRSLNSWEFGKGYTTIFVGFKQLSVNCNAYYMSLCRNL